MGLIFRKSTKILPGVRLNVSKNGYSFTFGGRGGSVNIGKKGAYANVGFGHGLRYRSKIADPAGKGRTRKAQHADDIPAGSGLSVSGLFGGTLAVLSLFGCIILFLTGQYILATVVLMVGVIGGGLLFLTSFNAPSVSGYDDEEDAAQVADEADAAPIEAVEPWRVLKVGLLIKEVGRLDPLFEDAVRLVADHGRCNTVFLQRNLSVDYTRACLLASQLSQTGLIRESTSLRNTYDLLFTKDDMKARLSALNDRGI